VGSQARFKAHSIFVVRHQLLPEIDVEPERDSAQRNSCYTTDAKDGQPRLPNRPQASLPADNQTEKIPH
jgi:hypothetical protein